MATIMENIKKGVECGFDKHSKIQQMVQTRIDGLPDLGKGLLVFTQMTSLTCLQLFFGQRVMNKPVNIFIKKPLICIAGYGLLLTLNAALEPNSEREV